MCRWLVTGEDAEIVHEVLAKHHQYFYQQAFAEAVGITTAAIAQACAIVSQSKLNDLQRLESHHPPMAIEGGVDDIRGIQDMGAGTKRKESQSSSSSGKGQKASAS